MEAHYVLGAGAQELNCRMEIAEIGIIDGKLECRISNGAVCGMSEFGNLADTAAGVRCVPTASMKSNELSQRTYQFGVAVVNFCKTLSDGPEARKIRGQLADSGTSVASNYRGTCRARSRAEFISTIGICVEEADESQIWLRMCADLGWCNRAATAQLIDEAEQLLKIFVASQLTARRRDRRS